MELLNNVLLRRILSVVLFAAGVLMVLYSDNVGRLFSSNPDFWIQMSGVGFATAGLMAIRVYTSTGLEMRHIALEGFLFAAAGALLVLFVNRESIQLIWFPALGAVVIAVFAALGRFRTA